MVHHARAPQKRTADAASVRGVRDVAISGEMIRLGQLLKLAGVAASGAEAKALLGRGDVWVNGQRESRRGRQLLRGDTVRGAGEELRIV